MVIIIFPFGLIVKLYHNHTKLVLTTFIQTGSNCVWTSISVVHKLYGWATNFMDGLRCPELWTCSQFSGSHLVHWMNVLRTSLVWWEYYDPLTLMFPTPLSVDLSFSHCRLTVRPFFPCLKLQPPHFPCLFVLLSIPTGSLRVWILWVCGCVYVSDCVRQEYDKPIWHT